MNPRYPRDVFAAMVVFQFASASKAQDMSVFYDYVENGVLKGGQITFDRSNPDHRRVFGLDRVGAQALVVWPVTTVLNNGPTANRIDIVMLGDGYTAGEMANYATHVDTILASFFAQEPFAAYKTYFNVHRVDVVSNESGVDEPDLGIFKDTALDMAYDCAGIDRLLCINISKAYDAAASAPAVDQIIALANSTRYGGAGYPFDNLGTLAGDNPSAVEIGLHEFGHSFADLADEYDYADGATYTGPEPIDANVSIFNAAQQLAQARKWYRWMDLPHVDSFVGAMYNQFGIYRPTSNSKMRSLNRPFEEINVEQFVISIYEVVSPIDDSTPSSPVPLPHTTEFFVTPLQPVDHGLDIQWFIDSVEVIGATSSTFTPSDVAVTPCLHNLTVTVIDNTARVRDPNARALWMTATRHWQIEVPGECPPPAIVPDNEGEKTRAISFSAPPFAAATATPGQSAIRVTMVELQNPVPPNLPQYPPPDFSGFEVGTCGDPGGCARWVGEPGIFLESQDSPGLGNFKAARLQCTPFYFDFAAEGLIHVTGAEIVPSSSYDVEVFASSCKGSEDTCTVVSAPVTMVTRRSGDVEAPFNPPSTTTQPNVTDVAQVVNKLKTVPGAPGKSIAQLQPNSPELNADINALDVVAVVDAVKQKAYAFGGPCPCPSAVMCGSTACTNATPCVTAFGPEALCIKTCSGGDNDGDTCINNSHCPGSPPGTCENGFCRDRCGRCTP